MTESESNYFPSQYDEISKLNFKKLDIPLNTLLFSTDDTNNPLNDNTKENNENNNDINSDNHFQKENNENHKDINFDNYYQKENKENNKDINIDNHNTNENNNDINSDNHNQIIQNTIINKKRKRNIISEEKKQNMGRKKKDFCDDSTHNKYSEDNQIKKIESNFTNFCQKHIKIVSGGNFEIKKTEPQKKYHLNILKIGSQMKKQ